MNERSYQNDDSAKMDDDLPPAYPQNPVQFAGYQNIGICNPSFSLENEPQVDANKPQPVFHEYKFKIKLSKIEQAFIF